VHIVGTFEEYVTVNFETVQVSTRIFTCTI